MPKFLPYDTTQNLLIPINLSEQLVPGTFEYTLNYLVDHELDTTIFHDHYHNDDNGRPAYDPAMLLKVVLFAYSRGITSSRQIARACRENVVFMALSADSQPHFTTIADFISRMHQPVGLLFLQILMTCDQFDLIGREMFAIDGRKMPSNAGKEWSGTHKELADKQKKLELMIARLIRQHREEDSRNEVNPVHRQEDEQRIKSLHRAAARIKQFLKTQPERRNNRKQPLKGNVTDPHSAKMKTSKGVIQGYNGVAAVDARHQVIMHARAYGRGAEQPTLIPMVEAVRKHCHLLGDHQDVMQKAVITADSGFHSKDNLQQLMDRKIHAVIADNRFRQRDNRFDHAGRYKKQHRKERYELAKKQGKKTAQGRYRPKDFSFDSQQMTCVCPAGKPMWLSSDRAKINGRLAYVFEGYVRHCRTCPQAGKCLRRKDQKSPRSVYFFYSQMPDKQKPDVLQLMKDKIDSPEGRRIYSKRLGTAEPPFGHLQEMGLTRFSLRGQDKVNGQWRLMCSLHNLKKIHRYGGDKLASKMAKVA